MGLKTIFHVSRILRLLCCIYISSSIKFGTELEFMVATTKVVMLGVGEEGGRRCFCRDWRGRGGGGGAGRWGVLSGGGGGERGSMGDSGKLVKRRVEV